MQLSWIPACQLRTIKLYRSQEDQLQSLPFRGNTDWPFASLPKETPSEAIPRTEQIRQSVPDD